MILYKMNYFENSYIINIIVGILILPILTAFNQGLLKYINNLFIRLKVYFYDSYINYLSINKIEYKYEMYFNVGQGNWIAAGNEELKESIVWYMNKKSDKYTGTNIMSIHKAVGKYDDIIKNKMENEIILTPNYVKVDDVEFYYTRNEKIDGSIRTNIDKITIISRKNNEELSKYLKNIYTEYIKFANQPKTELYLYKYLNKNIFRYSLNTNTHFDKLYLPEKDKLLYLLNKLENNKINKLSLLLHGEPGCGKTSIIRALSNYLKYDIMEIKLSEIKSDLELFNLFYNNVFKSSGERDSAWGNSSTKEYMIKKRIIVFEDIDCEKSVVLDRKLVTKNNNMTNDTNKLMKTILLTNLENKNEKSESNMDNIIDPLEKNKLTLSGMLNALDGIMQFNGSVIVLTTNYPENLDAALIRPGRINLKLELKRSTAKNSAEIIKSITDWDIDIIKDYEFTPALIEGLCGMAYTREDLIELILAERKKQTIQTI